MKKEKQFIDIEDYSQVITEQNQSDDAAHRAAACDEQTTMLTSEINKNGYAIVTDVFDVAQVAALKQEVIQLLGPTGRHGFEGFKTQRIYSMLQKTLCCNPLFEHPLILSLLDQLLLPNYLLSQTVAINIMSDEESQLIHHDDAFYSVARPRKALSVAAMWALDDFTAENGGTMIIPGSHDWNDKKPSEEDINTAIAIEMSAGSVCIFLGTLWHCGGANKTDSSRLGVTAQYCEPWCRTVENCFLSIPLETVKLCSRKMQSMLGYSLHGPFMGYVDDARHPALIPI